MSTRLVYAIIFYVLFCILMYLSKPALLFAEDGTLRRQGLMQDETLFSPVMACIVLAIISFYVFVIIDVIFEQ